MSEAVFDASRSGFASCIIGLEKSEERDTIPIVDLALLNIVVEEELGFQLGEEFIQTNVRASKLGGNFTGLTGKDGENSAKLVFLRYVGRGELIQDLAPVIDKRFIFFAGGTAFSREEVYEDRNALG